MDTVHQCVLVIGIGYLVFAVISNSANPFDTPIRKSHRRFHRIGLSIWLLLSLAALAFFHTKAQTEIGLLGYVPMSAIPILLISILVCDFLSGNPRISRHKRRKHEHLIIASEPMAHSTTTVSEDQSNEDEADDEYLDMTVNIDEISDDLSPIRRQEVKLPQSDKVPENIFETRSENIMAITAQAKMDKSARLAADRRTQILEEKLNLLRKENDYLIEDVQRIQAERNQLCASLDEITKQFSLRRA